MRSGCGTKLSLIGEFGMQEACISADKGCREFKRYVETV